MEGVNNFMASAPPSKFDAIEGTASIDKKIKSNIRIKRRKSLPGSSEARHSSTKGNLTTKPTHKGRFGRKINKKEAEDDECIFVESTPSTSDRANVDKELPRRSQRKRNQAEEEIPSEKPKTLSADTNTKRSNRFNVKDVMVEEVLSKSTHSHKTTTSTASLDTEPDEKKTQEHKPNASKTVQTNRRIKPVANSDGIAHAPPLKKRAIRVDPQIPDQIDRPNGLGRKRGKQMESDPIESTKATASEAKPNPKATRGRTKVPKEPAVEPNGPKKRQESTETNVAQQSVPETIAVSVPKQKAGRSRKKTQPVTRSHYNRK